LLIAFLFHSLLIAHHSLLFFFTHCSLLFFFASLRLCVKFIWGQSSYFCRFAASSIETGAGLIRCGGKTHIAVLCFSSLIAFFVAHHISFSTPASVKKPE
jgi:hypothetical protein